jgi:hypothetical protein
MHRLGWTLLAIGAATQVAETMAHQEAALKELQFQDTKVGMIVAPIEGVLPISLGWTLIAIGAVILWVLPHLTKVKT